MKNKKLGSATTQSAHAPPGLGKRALGRFAVTFKLAAAGLLALSSILPGHALAQTETSGALENLPALQTTNASGTLAALDALSEKLDGAISKSAAAVDNYATAINAAAAGFTPALSNAVETAEMECFRVAAEGLRQFVQSAPQAMQLHAAITAKGDRIASMLATRLSVRLQAAKQLAQARNVPIELVEIELSPTEAATLREWAIVSDETKFTQLGTKLHTDRLQEVMSAVSTDRAKLAQEGENLAQSIRRMEMLERCVKRFAADALAEHEFKGQADEFRRESGSFQQLSERYRRFTHLGERSIGSRISRENDASNTQLGGPVQ